MSGGGMRMMVIRQIMPHILIQILEGRKIKSFDFIQANWVI